MSLIDIYMPDIAKSVATQGYEIDPQTATRSFAFGDEGFVVDTHSGDVSVAAYIKHKSRYSSELDGTFRLRGQYDPALTVGGRLVDSAGYFALSDTGVLPNDNAKGKELAVFLLSTADGVNSMYAAMGHRLGESCLMISTIPGTPDIPAPKIVEGMTRRTVYAADPHDNWGLAEHDLRPIDHTPGWPCFTPRMLKAAADRAGIVMDRYMPDGVEASGIVRDEVINYAKAVDAFAGFARPLHRLVINLVYSKQQLGLAQRDVWAELGRPKTQAETRAHGGPKLRDYINTLQTVGVIPQPHKDTVSGAERLRTISREIVSHLAGNIIALEENVPSEQVDDDRRRKGIDALAEVITEYADAA